ncbi:hypothetical protein GCM10010052_11180 [Paenarthrobacter histidinolovorans]|nr:hypothetical protein GCM10010052_11180 [Paenarthrobacter histidinolovorans]
MVATSTRRPPEVMVAVSAALTTSVGRTRGVAVAGWMTIKPSEDEATTQAKLNEARRLGDDKRGMMLLIDYCE